MERSKPQFLTLPPEIREEIYRLLLSPRANRCYHDDDYTSYDYSPALPVLRVNRQVYYEARKIFRDLNVFVRIETPWPEAQQHVALQGHVPILVADDKATNFTDHSMTVSIDAPEHPMLEWESQRFIILLNDLDKFTRMWFYADLTHPRLNEHLRLNLCLRDPFAPAYEEKRIPKAVQRRLILPFGEVKNLCDTIITGNPKPYHTLASELKALQAQPPESAESCLRRALQFKAEGNTELNAGNYQNALKSYSAAWRAIHVVIKGHMRHIHGDAFFSREMTEEPFKGRNGQSERLTLRVQLVANTCQAYLKMGEYDECKFWGMRSISMLREAMGADDRHGIAPQDEAILGFPAADQMGKIYYRVALAYKELGDVSEARRLLRVAAIYLPRDESVKKEVAATALKLG